MAPYAFKRALLRVGIALPMPAFLARLCRLYRDASVGEGFADMTINGEARFLVSQATDCRVVIDAGAHHGEWTRRALAANDRLAVHCFEPVSSHYRVLVANPFPERVVCNAVGLSEEPGQRLIDVATGSLHSAGAGSGDDGPTVDTEGGREEAPRTKGVSETARRTEVVDLITLDGYCREHRIERVDFLKIDVEGHELAVLRGAREMISAGRIKRVQFEYGPCNIDSRVLLRDLFGFFEEFDYDLFQVAPKWLVPVTYDRLLENFRYKNFAALHRSLQKTAR